jgi:NAD(P)-dependent dehydrogenase (short-subunit alcohol dehydrogenase family)
MAMSKGVTGAAGVAVVTGSTRGIGRAVADALAADGLHVVICGTKRADAESVAADLRAAGRDASGRGVDVSSSADVDALGKHVEGLGRCDVLVNNAGILPEDDGALSVDLDVLRRALEVNTIGPLRVTQRLAPLLKASGKGRVVNVSTGMAQLHDMGTGSAAYRISKTALQAVTRLLAHELQNDGCLVNAVCPGWVRTAMGGSSAPRAVEQGADSVLWAVRLGAEGPTGGFFRDGRRLEW